MLSDLEGLDDGHDLRGLHWGKGGTFSEAGNIEPSMDVWKDEGQVVFLLSCFLKIPNTTIEFHCCNVDSIFTMSTEVYPFEGKT